MSLSEVSNVLWRERRMLDLLLFKLEEEELVLASGRTRWLSHATREVESILEEMQHLELTRAMALAGAAGELGHVSDPTRDTPTLRELAAIAPPPWDGLFAEHRHALLLLAHEIDAITESNRHMLRRGRLATRERLAALGEIGVDGDLGYFDADIDAGSQSGGSSPLGYLKRRSTPTKR